MDYCCYQSPCTPLQNVEKSKALQSYDWTIAVLWKRSMDALLEPKDGAYSVQWEDDVTSSRRQHCIRDILYIVVQWEEAKMRRQSLYTVYGSEGWANSQFNYVCITVKKISYSVLFSLLFYLILSHRKGPRGLRNPSRHPVSAQEVGLQVKCILGQHRTWGRRRAMRRETMQSLSLGHLWSQGFWLDWQGWYDGTAGSEVEEVARFRAVTPAVNSFSLACHKQKLSN